MNYTSYFIVHGQEVRGPNLLVIIGVSKTATPLSRYSSKANSEIVRMLQKQKSQGTRKIPWSE